MMKKDDDEERWWRMKDENEGWGWFMSNEAAQLKSYYDDYIVILIFGVSWLTFS